MIRKITYSFKSNNVRNNLTQMGNNLKYTKVKVVFGFKILGRLQICALHTSSLT